MGQSSYQEALELFRDAAARLREREDVGLAKVLNNLGLVEEALGLQDQARSSFEQSITLSRERGLKDTLGYALASLAHLLLDNNPTAATEHYRESLEVMQQTHDPRGIAYCLEGCLWCPTGLEAGSHRDRHLRVRVAAIRGYSTCSITQKSRASELLVT